MKNSNLRKWWLISTARTIYSLVGSLAFIVLGIYLILTAENRAETLNPLIVKIIGGITILFFGFVAFFALRDFFNWVTKISR